MGTRKNILLTGASGTVGYAALHELLKKKEVYAITVFDVKSKNAKQKFAPFENEIKIVYGDISNIRDVEKVCSNQDFVIHLAAIIPPLADDEPELSHKVNTIGTQNLVKCLEEKSPEAFFLYSSSISVYGDRLHTPWIRVDDEINPSKGDEYAKTKIAAEKIIRNSKLRWSIFRLSAIMGGHKISKLMFHQPLKTSLEIASPEDTARAFVNAIEKQDELARRTFNLGGGESCRILYADFLSESFKINGLGELDFPPKTFAEKNFHCGYYADGDVLNDIVEFRRDSLESHFEKEKNKISPFRKTLACIFKKPIKRTLQKKSEPLEAYQNNDQELIELYFG